MKGRVKRWFASRGFGFLTRDDGRDFFVHATGIVSDAMFKDLREGDRVEFELGPARDPAQPPAAVNVRRLTEETYST